MRFSHAEQSHFDAELLKPGDQALPGMGIAVVGDLRQIIAGIVVAFDNCGALLGHADIPSHIVEFRVHQRRFQRQRLDLFVHRHLIAFQHDAGGGVLVIFFQLLIMALPGTPETVGILSRERIALLPENALVINVGRGNAVDQAALADALNGGRIAGAALDVAVPEPLPENDPLWDAKNLILTPHISGNLTLGYTCDRNVELFCEDLANYAAGRPLAHLVDRKRGY